MVFQAWHRSDQRAFIISDKKGEPAASRVPTAAVPQSVKDDLRLPLAEL